MGGVLNYYSLRLSFKFPSFFRRCPLGAILKGGAYGSEEEGKNKEEGKKEKITLSVIGCGVVALV